MTFTKHADWRDKKQRRPTAATSPSGWAPHKPHTPDSINKTRYLLYIINLTPLLMFARSPSRLGDRDTLTFIIVWDQSSFSSSSSTSLFL